MAYSNKESLNHFKSTNININEINNKMLSTIENFEKDNVYLYYNSHKIINLIRKFTNSFF